MTFASNVDPQEVAKFSELAHRWWDPHSEFKPLHDINPLRLAWIDRCIGLNGKVALDVGCGGGLLSEGMASCGARVTGIDMSEKALGVAKLHLHETGLCIDYQLQAAESMATKTPASFDIVTCMEMLEHVPDPASTVAACASLVKPGGQVFFSTINRNPKAYLFAVVGAEYILNMLPKGTHDYTKFLRPAELARFARESGLAIQEIIGMSYNPLTKTYSLGTDTSVNYLMRASRPL